MREYVVQYNNGRYACGPVALLNAMRFQGHRACRRHLPWLANRLEVDVLGTDYTILEREGSKLGALKRLRRASHKLVENQLKKGNGVVVRIQMVDRKAGNNGRRMYGHVFLISAIWIHRDNVSMYITNVGGRNRWMTWDDLEKFYNKRYKDHWFACAWTVPQQKKKGVRLVG